MEARPRSTNPRASTGPGVVSRLRYVVVGDTALAASCAEVVREAGHNLVAVVTDDPVVAQWVAGTDEDLLRPRSDLDALVAEQDVDLLLYDAPERLPHSPTDGPVHVGFHDGSAASIGLPHQPSRSLIEGRDQHQVVWFRTAGDGRTEVLAHRGFPIPRSSTALELGATCF